ncbi:MAG: hypothetical protein OXG35_05340, partial [Acidobacteria bacterium]|nr:hypothetical protein [Acidobacteriota bacterium]
GRPARAGPAPPRSPPRPRRGRAPRFMPGTMVASQPIVPEPIPVRFPFPPFATNPDEAAADEKADKRKTGRILSNLGALPGPEVDL